MPNAINNAVAFDAAQPERRNCSMGRVCSVMGKGLKIAATSVGVLGCGVIAAIGSAENSKLHDNQKGMCYVTGPLEEKFIHIWDVREAFPGMIEGYCNNWFYEQTGYITATMTAVAVGTYIFYRACVKRQQ
jgi:hypothetical protein